MRDKGGGVGVGMFLSRGGVKHMKSEELVDVGSTRS